jgi:hypothetical protein
MARYIQNYVNRTEGIGALKLEPPGDLAVPPLRTYIYIPVTGQIISRLASQGDDQDPQSAKKKISSGSSTPPTQEKAATDTPNPSKLSGVKRKLQLGSKDDSDDDEDADDDDDNDEVEDDAAAELEMLDQLEKASSSSKKKKKKSASIRTTGGAAVKAK